jgi:hypothetical protein
MQSTVKESNAKQAAHAKKFEFARDTFAFANELHWEYRIDENGKTTTFKNDPPPNYAHHCFVVVRAAKQFFLHAKFDSSLPKLSDVDYAQRVRQLMRRSVEHVSAEKIVIPGFANLREFTATHKTLAQTNCGGSWQSYVQRGNWRMVFPFSRTHQEREAKKLLARIHTLPIVHIVTFPGLTINHGIMLFDAIDSEDQVEFRAYDPNIIDRPVNLFFDKAKRTFTFPRNHYFAGGALDVYQIYYGLFF